MDAASARILVVDDDPGLEAWLQIPAQPAG